MCLAETHLGKNKQVLQNTVLRRRLGDVGSNVERTGLVLRQMAALVLAVLNVSILIPLVSYFSPSAKQLT